MDPSKASMASGPDSGEERLISMCHGNIEYQAQGCQPPMWGRFSAQRLHTPVRCAFRGRKPFGMMKMIHVMGRCLTGHLGRPGGEW